MSGPPRIAARQARPLSPASASSSPKLDDISSRPVFAGPNTPDSPSLMSSTPQNHVPSPAAHQAPSTMTSQPSSQLMDSPPNSSSSKPGSQPIITTTTNTFPTPASSTAGTVPPSTQPDDGDVQMSESDGPPGEVTSHATTGIADDAMAIDRNVSDYTNHERQASVVEPGDGSSRVSGQDKGKGIDQGARHGEELSIEGKIGLERLHADIGQPYLLLKSPHPPTRPQPTQNLISLYGLDPLAATVARKDKFGQKINKLRKSYEGKIKDFNLAGKNKPAKHEEGQPGGLLELVQWPDEEWQNQKLFGKEMTKGLGDALMAKLDKAMTMEPGPIPDDDKWRTVLGLDDDTLRDVSGAGGKKQGLQGVAGGSASQADASTSRGAAAAAAPSPTTPIDRPRRSGKKRSYRESSFAGYGEGYGDDDGELGFSTGDDDDGRRANASKKKRRKDSVGKSPPPLGGRGGSYGVGMVGVGSGIGAR
ncbi:Rox3-domain-containing protein [Xylona heveae TC161]|uniref:Mediator of RNA polymerase II transcription subunit 19 n=1 Tax=Xylona heveae (strain CBS 132557 / TC161) TaxID=1328760 RepID=A0A165JN47_XYLHT|nr:Rox3-domain-containing protein [Xylona heveae TC161]KZF26440.1 Rox3-domain-containing protein [Xylona heveae TC161]